MSFVTWNLAMLERSAQAPSEWGMEHTEAEVRSRLLAAAPDLVLFQELPRMVPYLETHGMIRANPETHNGNLAILVRHQLLADEGVSGPQVVTVKGCGVLVTFASGLTIANVHLAPGQGAMGERLEQLAQIVESSPTPHLLIVGDTNTRVEEEVPLAEAGLTGAKPPHATWNSKSNRFHRNSARFNAYFTRWFATESVEVSDVEVWRDPVVHNGKQFHLSDHFAMSGSVRFSAPADQDG